jgi:hypothetical protein
MRIIVIDTVSSVIIIVVIVAIYGMCIKLGIVIYGMTDDVVVAKVVLVVTFLL